MTTLQPGQTLGPYRIIEQIGQGGMATVYKAYHAAMDRYVAVKVLPQQLAESAEFAGRFQQEARTIANLEHARILPVYDSGEAGDQGGRGGVPYLVMRYLEAGTLKDRLKDGAPPLADTDRWFTQLAEALDYAHRRGVIHRDLKPSNALVDAQNDLYLTDFGIAKLLESGAHFTTTGAMVGTPAYMSPEQAQAEKVDQRTDIYSLGIILYEMVTGRVPFEAETPLAVVLKQINAPLPLPSSLKPDLSPAIERVLLKALAKNPVDRYGSAAEFLAAWKAALAEAPTARAIASPPTAKPIAPRAPARFPLPLVLGGLGAAALLLFGVVMLPRLFNRAAPEATAPASTPTEIALAATVSVITTDAPTAEPEATAPEAGTAASGWTSWTAVNDVAQAAFFGEEILTWSWGGITRWGRDGSLLGHLRPVEGLPHVIVHDVKVDADRGGFWAATEGGVGFFDGERWTVYDRQDGLDSPAITALALTSRGLVAGTSFSGVDGGGLFRFDGATWEAVPGFPSTGDSENAATLSYNVNVVLPIIQSDATTGLWVGTEHGLGRFDGATWTTFFEAQGLPGLRVYALLLDDGGGVWAGTENGAARFNGETFEPVERTLGRGIYGIVQAADGAYWFSGDGGLARFDAARGDWQIYSQDNGDLPAYTLTRSARDEDGTLYFGSFGGGLVRYDGQRFDSWVVPNSLSTGAYAGILLAPDGTLWFVQEYSAGVDRFDRAAGAWSRVSLPCEYCVPLAFDGEGNLWLGGEQGLWIAASGDPAHLTTTDGLPSDRVSAVAFDAQWVWVGTEAGVALVSANGVEQVLTTANAGFGSDLIHDLFAAPDGSMWVATAGGLSQRTPEGAWTHYGVGNPFKEGFDGVWSVAQDATGAVWAGTRSAGVYRWRNGEWEHFEGPDFMRGAPDANGGMWFGSYNSGASYFAGDEWQTFGMADGLIHPNVNRAYVDASGAVWFATSGGVSRYVP